MMSCLQLLKNMKTVTSIATTTMTMAVTVISPAVMMLVISKPCKNGLCHFDHEGGLFLLFGGLGFSVLDGDFVEGLAEVVFLVTVMMIIHMP